MINRQFTKLCLICMFFFSILIILFCEERTEKSIPENKIAKENVIEERGKDKSNIDSTIFLRRSELSKDEAQTVFKKRNYRYESRQEFERLLEQANTLRKINNVDIRTGVTTPPMTMNTIVLPGTNISGLTEDAYGDLFDRENSLGLGTGKSILNFDVHNFVMNFCMYLDHVDDLSNIKVGSELKIRNIAAMKLKIDVSPSSLAGQVVRGTVDLVSANRYFLAVKNKQDTTIHFQVTKGRVFDEGDYDNIVQSMIVSRDVNVELNAHETRRINVEMYCMELRKPSPGNRSLVITPFITDFYFLSQQDIWNVYESM